MNNSGCTNQSVFDKMRTGQGIITPSPVLNLMTYKEATMSEQHHINLTGLCQCGCGRPAPIAKHTNKEYGHVKGMPARYICGHNANLKPEEEINGIPLRTKNKFMDYFSPEPNSGCWIWVKCINPCGYGQMWDGHRRERAYIVSYKLFNGPIKTHTHIHHTCGNKQCVNPEHLVLMSVSEHMRTHTHKNTHCVNGHLLNVMNLRITKSGIRVCKSCVRNYMVKNKELILKKKREHYINHKEEISLRKHAYEMGHRAEKLEYNIKYRMEHRDEIREYNKAHKLKMRLLRCK